MAALARAHNDGRNNHAAVDEAFGHDFIHTPSDLALPGWAAMASAWWRKAHGFNEIAHTGDSWPSRGASTAR